MTKRLLSILLPLLILFKTTLYAEDLFGDFVAKQIEIERQFLDKNVTNNVVEDLIEEQNHDYKELFLALISKNSDDIKRTKLYISEMSTLNRRMKINKQRNNTRAYTRDEIKLNSYMLLNNIHSTFYQLIQATNSSSNKEFNDKIDTIVSSRHQGETLILQENYSFLEDEEDKSEMTQSIRTNLYENQILLNLHNTLSSELVRFKEPMYDAIKLSSFGLISLTYKINTSTIGKTVNEYIVWSGLDSSKVIFIILILLGFYWARRVVVFISGLLLENFFDRSDDISFIIKNVSGVFSVIMIVVTLDIIANIYSGFVDLEWIDRTFYIAYTVLFTYLIQRLINAGATIKMEHLRGSEYLRHEVINLAMRVINILVYIIGLIVLLNLFNVDLSAILSGLGIGGFAVAFAAKDTIANFFGSVSILMGDLFEQGDWIAVDGYEGTVVEIGLRATTIRTFDNAMIAIPNFKLADNGLKNWSKRQLGRRIKMHVGVTYESDFNDIKQAVQEIREMLIEHPEIANNSQEMLHSERYVRLVSKEDYKGIKRTMLVYMDKFSDSSIDILIYCYSKSVIWNEWLETKEDVMYKIAEILERNNLSFAYPAMAIHSVSCEENK
ncbi:MAG: mechanosensitive ion channel family protein [Campylobacterota bacterium]|nr:mechanosensitive ion channel family protein [Campylobacterota bacterium]